MKVFTVEIKVNNDISYRDIERALNEIDAETKLFDIKELEDA